MGAPFDPPCQASPGRAGTDYGARTAGNMYMYMLRFSRGRSARHKGQGRLGQGRDKWDKQARVLQNCLVMTTITLTGKLERQLI